MSLIEWLLDSDPSIRWQVMRDLTGEPDATIARERRHDLRPREMRIAEAVEQHQRRARTFARFDPMHLHAVRTNGGAMRGEEASQHDDARPYADWRGA